MGRSKFSIPSGLDCVDPRPRMLETINNTFLNVSLIKEATCFEKLQLYLIVG